MLLPCEAAPHKRIRRAVDSLSEACEQRVKRFPVVKSGDWKEIKRYSEFLGKTLVIVGDEKHFSRLDSLDTLTSLITKLPNELRRQWIKRSVQVENTTGTQAKFSILSTLYSINQKNLIHYLARDL